MRSFGFRLTLLVAILWAGLGSTAWALGHHGDTVETVYVMPSSVSMPIPTSYVVSTGWVEPTAYAVPTYYTTAYWMDPVVLAQPTYATTAYVRRGLFGRRWLVERPVLATYATTYVPTAYYVGRPVYRSTSYAVVDRDGRADPVCRPDRLRLPAGRGHGGPGRPGPVRHPRTPAPRRARNGSRSRNVESEPDDLSTIDSNVGPRPGDTRAAGSSGAPGRRGAASDPGHPPAGCAGGRQGYLAAGTAAPRPQPPGDSSGRRPEPGGQTGTPGGQHSGRSTTRRPATGTAPAATPRPPGAPTAAGPPARRRRPLPRRPRRDRTPCSPGPPPAGRGPPQFAAAHLCFVRVRPELRNVLIGTVLSSAAREPEEGVRISVRNANGGRAKSTTTNAFGRFAVRLADGDWAVDVTMPSGNVYEVSQIRVSDGVITDSLGRRVPSLEITR